MLFSETFLGQGGSETMLPQKYLKLQGTKIHLRVFWVLQKLSKEIKEGFLLTGANLFDYNIILFYFYSTGK